MLAVGMLVVGCGGEKDGAENGMGNSNAVVNGKPASEFFTQFLAKKYTYIDTQRGDQGEFYSEVTFEMDAIASRNGNPIIADGVLFLNTNGTYRFVYREYEKDRGVKIFLGKKSVTGKYQVAGTRLQLAGLGEVNGGTYNSYQALYLSFSTDILSAGLSGENAIGIRSISRRSAQEESNSDMPTNQFNFEDQKQRGTFNELSQ